VPQRIKRRSSRKRQPLWVLFVAAIVLIGITGFVARDEIADAAVRFLIASDSPQKSDLIYILGGNYLVRAPAGAALFRQGWAPKILLAREPTGFRRDGTAKENFTDVTKKILIDNGVPADRIIEFFPATGVRSTADEAHALRLYLQAYPASKILLVTSEFHTRRARMALSRAIPSATRVLVVAVHEPGCGVTNWRETSACRHEVKTELVKFVYYFFAFWG
jgi:uncharacterized SAM-binding protein YcdF (DUF218 family)